MYGWHFNLKKVKWMVWSENWAGEEEGVGSIQHTFAASDARSIHLAAEMFGHFEHITSIWSLSIQ